MGNQLSEKVKVRTGSLQNITSVRIQLCLLSTTLNKSDDETSTEARYEEEEGEHQPHQRDPPGL